ncbi:MAG: methyltransferase [Gammaproteobacteria bacterium]|nr:methyltransferase [Gammaproteobacteria bacterium]
MFTYQYHQPAEYHFSMDSIHLAELVADRLQTRTDLASLRVLDLCAGCGVIGMELSWYLREIKHIDFIEIQNCYIEHFHKNVTSVNRPELQLNFHLLNYDELQNDIWKNKFDLIVSNPPYFHEGHGMLSPSTFKNRCRFFLDSSFENFILGIVNSLSSNGQAYFLLRPLKQHGKDLLFEIKKLLKEQSATAKIISQIRGTDVVCIEKKIGVRLDK